MSKTITVFGSSKPLPGEDEYEIAYKLGRRLGEAGFTVCSGGYQGIMDAVSKGAVESGAEAIGVTVDLFNAVASKHLTKEIECHTLFERIEKLVELGDAFVILTGGTGTLLELSVVWELVNKNLIDKKPIACNGEMWLPIIESIDNRMGFESREVGLIKWFREINDCTSFLVESLRE